MQKHADESPARQHTLSDWLALHGLDAVACRRILDAAPQEIATTPAGHGAPDLERYALDPEDAWLRTADAMRAFFPAQRSMIDDTFENTIRVLVDQPNKSRRALTLDNGPAAYPKILYSYLGEPADSLVIAHEFAHAVQIRASQGKFVAPIIREVCAFVGEWALLSHALHSDPAQHRRLSQVWDTDNKKFFGSHTQRLNADLSRPETPYRYSWNYPIARYLAIRMFQQRLRDQMWAVFEGDLSVQGVLQHLPSN